MGWCPAVFSSVLNLTAIINNALTQDEVAISSYAEDRPLYHVEEPGDGVTCATRGRWRWKSFAQVFTVTAACVATKREAWQDVDACDPDCVWQERPSRVVPTLRTVQKSLWVAPRGISGNGGYVVPIGLLGRRGIGSN